MQQTEEPFLKSSTKTQHFELWLEKKLKRKKPPVHILAWVMLFLSLAMITCIAFSLAQVHKMQKKEKRLRKDISKLKYQTISTEALGHLPIPLHLSGVPFGEDTGIITHVKTISIKDVHAPHNPSIIASKTGYDLFFRYDIVSSKARHLPYYSHIGTVSLGFDFEQKTPFQRIDLPSQYVEDPRVTKVGENLYLTFNMLDENKLRCRFMSLASLDPATFRVNYVTPLDLNLQWVEKNWGSFEYIHPDNRAELILEYQINPRTLFSLPNPEKNTLKQILLPSEAAYSSFPWSTWGHIRGGTPAQKIGDEYLAFFHSSFTEKNGLVWYVMGAYTFQAEPPFTITKISPYPILFRGIFDSPITNTAQHYKRVVFPSGFVIENDQIHLACGENDSAIKIVTFDKKRLLESLQPLNLSD